MSDYKHGRYCLGIDVGGSHVSAALVDADTGEILGGRIYETKIDSKASAWTIMNTWRTFTEGIVGQADADKLSGIGIAMPGPFDYPRGISMIAGVDKYESIFGADIKHLFRMTLDDPRKPVVFTNDAFGFAMGEYHAGAAQGSRRTIAVTLGTGFGSTFLIDGIPQTEGDGVPRDGFLYHCPFGGTIADDCFSTRWFVGEWKKRTGEELTGAAAVAEKAQAGDAEALDVFRLFGENLAEFISGWFAEFGPDTFVIGGNIARAFNLFGKPLQDRLAAGGFSGVTVRTAGLADKAPVVGAAMYAAGFTGEGGCVTSCGKDFADKGYSALAEWLKGHKCAVVDGSEEIAWDDLVLAVDTGFRKEGINAAWFHASAAMTNTIGMLDENRAALLKPDPGFDINVLVGTGAASAGWDAPAVYAEMSGNGIVLKM